MKHISTAAVVVLSLGLGCGKSGPGPASVPLTLVASSSSGEPVVVVGDPTHMPGRYGGPCKNEDCGHEKCIDARKFIADANPCAVCEKPITWGDEIVVFFTDGKTSKAAGGGGPRDIDSNWQSRLKEIDVLCHEKCREKTKCEICNFPLAVRNQPFHAHDGKWSHDNCYASQKPPAKPSE